MASAPEQMALAPRHPIPEMQGAFEESMRETMQEPESTAKNPYLNADKAQRRKLLLEGPKYERIVGGRWMQKQGENYHPLWKLIAQISFGMHLLQRGLAKSDEEVIRLLQEHVDEIDGFLERTTEDFDLAQHDIDERIRYLRLPLEHGDVFDGMLADRAFRHAIVDGNEKIERIVQRTSLYTKDTMKDVQKGLDGTRALNRFLRELDRRWVNKSEDHENVYSAMMGNTEGWDGAYRHIQTKARELDHSLLRLGGVISEIQRRAGVASRRNLPSPKKSPPSSRHSQIVSQPPLHPPPQTSVPPIPTSQASSTRPTGRQRSPKMTSISEQEPNREDSARREANTKAKEKSPLLAELSADNVASRKSIHALMTAAALSSKSGSKSSSINSISAPVSNLDNEETGKMDEPEQEMDQTAEAMEETEEARKGLVLSLELEEKPESEQLTEAIERQLMTELNKSPEFSIPLEYQESNERKETALRRTTTDDAETSLAEGTRSVWPAQPSEAKQQEGVEEQIESPHQSQEETPLSQQTSETVEGSQTPDTTDKPIESNDGVLGDEQQISEERHEAQNRHVSNEDKEAEEKQIVSRVDEPDPEIQQKKGTEVPANLPGKALEDPFADPEVVPAQDATADDAQSHTADFLIMHDNNTEVASQKSVNYVSRSPQLEGQTFFGYPSSDADTGSIDARSTPGRSRSTTSSQLAAPAQGLNLMTDFREDDDEEALDPVDDEGGVVNHRHPLLRGPRGRDVLSPSRESPGLGFRASRDSLTSEARKNSFRQSDSNVRPLESPINGAGRMSDSAMGTPMSPTASDPGLSSARVVSTSTVRSAAPPIAPAPIQTQDLGGSRREDGETTPSPTLAELTSATVSGPIIGDPFEYYTPSYVQPRHKHQELMDRITSRVQEHVDRNLASIPASPAKHTRNNSNLPKKSPTDEQPFNHQFSQQASTTTTTTSNLSPNPQYLSTNTISDGGTTYIQTTTTTTTSNSSANRNRALSPFQRSIERLREHTSDSKAGNESTQEGKIAQGAFGNKKGLKKLFSRRKKSTSENF